LVAVIPRSGNLLWN